MESPAAPRVGSKTIKLIQEGCEYEETCSSYENIPRRNADRKYRGKIPVIVTTQKDKESKSGHWIGKHRNWVRNYSNHTPLQAECMGIVW